MSVKHCFITNKVKLYITVESTTMSPMGGYALGPKT